MINNDLKLSSYNYDLPENLIAQYPSKKRDHSRLLVYDKKTDLITHDYFYNLSKHLNQSSNLVLNNTKVFPSRLLGKKLSGGKAEMLILKPHPDPLGLFEVMIKCSGKKKIGDQFIFSGGAKVIIKEILNKAFKVSFFNIDLNDKYLQENALTPIPPYIRSGISNNDDITRYQTIYAKDSGAVAAPTAGLHFSENVFTSLKEKNISTNYLTLNVGPGTFAPVKEDQIINHQMHSEDFYIDEHTLKNINKNKKIYAVGTTSLRVLASIYNSNSSSYDFDTENWSKTDIFLHPPMKIDYISGLITNFHLPKSSLLMLVSCLIGRKRLMNLYQIAIEKKYRFYSYGDSMLIKL